MHYALLGMLMRTLAGRAGARKRSLVALIVRDDRRGLARPCGAGYQDLLRQGRAALSHGIFRRPRSGTGALRRSFPGSGAVRPIGK